MFFGRSGVFHDDTIRANWSATVRGRLGYAVTPTVLAYATAGAAWLDTSVAVAGLGRFSNTLAGYAVGGGIEAITPWHDRAKLRLEYLYTSYEGWAFNASDLVSEKLNPDMHQVRLGIVIPLAN